MDIEALPDQVRQAAQLAAAVGFEMSCDPDTGRTLAVLAAAVRPGGRVLELGTGARVGTAWISYGLAHRSNVEVVTVELDRTTADYPSTSSWPSWINFAVGDAVEITRRAGTFDLIFADAPGGKCDGLDITIAALKPGAHLLVDDMSPENFVDAETP